MNHKNLLIFLFSFLFFQPAYAQSPKDSIRKNLVPNPSFEEINSCPEDYGAIEEAEGWTALNFTPDLFSICTKKAAISVPVNFFGKQKAATGNSYAGLLMYHERSPLEVISCRLSEPVKKGERYLVSFKASLAEEYSNYTSNNLCILFTNDPTEVLNSKKSHLRYIKLLNNSRDWVTIADTIVADDNYNFLVLGNLYGKDNTLVKKIQNGAYPAAYYYIDDIEVIRTPRKVVRQEFIKVFGKVEDAVTKKPVEARIDFVLNNIRYRAFETTDPKTGRYQFSNMLLTSFFVLEAKSPGYFSALEFIQTQDQRTFERNFSLSPVKIGAVKIIENIVFDQNRASIKPESNFALDMVANFLKENDTFFVEISGHTDNTGDPGNNQKLSEDRAEAVVKYLVEKGGIEQNRLRAKGYGDTLPIAPNDYEEGKAKNRRVELKILQ